MKLGQSSRIIYLLVMLASVSLLSFGCNKKTAPPEEMATSEAVVAEEKPVVPETVVETEPVAEEVVQAEETVEETNERAGKSSHKVRRGDNLWNIAQSGEVYDDPFSWPLIYKANMDQIKDPDLIYPNQKFEIPRDSSNSEVASAITEAKTRGPWSLWDGK